MKNFNVKTKFSVLFLSLLFGASMLASNAYAGQGNTKGQKKHMSGEKQAKKARAVSGMVIKKKMVRLPAENKANLVVLLKTNKANDRLLVDLGDADALKKHNISDKTELQIEGRMAKVGVHQILVANNLKINGKMISIDRSFEESMAEKFKNKPKTRSE